MIEILLGNTIGQQTNKQGQKLSITMKKGNYNGTLNNKYDLQVFYKSAKQVKKKEI